MTEALKPTLANKAAVLEGMPDHPAVKALEAWNSAALVEARFDFGELTLTIAPDQIRAAAATVQAAGYNFFEDMTAVDPSVESITAVWAGANYYEREVFDLFGIRFEGHPNLRRIMLPDEWKGHPLRKDYPVEGYR